MVSFASKAKRVTMNFLMYILFVILKTIVPLFPLRFIRKICRLKGRLFYYILPVRKNTAINNLKLAFPEKNEKEIKKIVKSCYINILTVIAEFFYMNKLDKKSLAGLINMENPELIKEKLKQGNGLILISGHFGNWELTAYGAAKLCNTPFNVVIKEQTNKKVNEEINRIRSEAGNKLIDMRNSLREILTVLKNNGVVAMLGDQAAPKENVKINFFVKDVPAFEGTAKIAIKTGAAVLFGVSVRNPDGTYNVKLHEIDTSKYSDASEENIKNLTQEHADLLADYIRQRPDHWLWFHRRFKNVG